MPRSLCRAAPRGGSAQGEGQSVDINRTIIPSGHEEPAPAANRVLEILSQMFSLGEAWGLSREGGNPCRSVVKYKRRKRERFLTEQEYRRLGRVLGALEAEGRMPAHAAAALRLLMLTGCRLNEILTLRWDDVDRTAAELRLREAKTGARMGPLTPTAAVLAGITRGSGNPWVIAGGQPGSRLTHLSAYWYRARKRAGLGDVRIHDLRHPTPAARWRWGRA